MSHIAWPYYLSGSGTVTGILIAVFLRGPSGTLNLDRTQWLADPVGICLITEKKCFTAIKKSAELFITTSHSTISSPFAGCTAYWNSHQLLECQDASSSTKAAKHFWREGDWNISFFQAKESTLLFCNSVHQIHVSRTAVTGGSLPWLVNNKSSLAIWPQTGLPIALHSLQIVSRMGSVWYDFTNQNRQEYKFCG